MRPRKRVIQGMRTVLNRKERRQETLKRRISRVKNKYYSGNSQRAYKKPQRRRRTIQESGERSGQGREPDKEVQQQEKLPDNNQ